jgi:hypothetical protein
MTETAPIPLSPSPTPLTPGQAAAPTLGATLGSAVGAIIVAHLGPVGPLLSGTITTATTAAFTALFHWVGTKLGALKL